MSTDSIDWIFDSSREGTIPKGEGSWWRLIVKYWVLGAIFSCLASIAVAVTAVMRPQSVPVEYVLAGVMGVLILLFCLFLVRMTYRCAIRRRRNRNLDRAAKCHRENRWGIYLVLACVLGMAIPCALAEEWTCTNTVPSVAWSSRSGFGPFKEIRKVSYESAGWLKWLFDAHRLRLDIQIEEDEPYVFDIRIPRNMQLTHVSCHRERANRLTKDEHDFGWCKVTRELGWAEITIPACRRKLSLRLAFHEFGWPFFRVGDKCSPEFLVCDPVAPQYDHGRVVYQEFLDEPCATPLSAAHAAERIFVTLYGKGSVSGRPWRVAETNGCYIVTGTLSEGGSGDASQLKMQKKDGRVWVYGRRKWQHGNEHLPK